MLADAQKRLEQHFSALKNERATREYPVYAFEHGLQLSEVEAIREELQRRLKENRQLQRENWLLWTVVAAEIGYAYDGEEYWQSFKKEIPQWHLYGDRNLMRLWFKTFASRFSGFSPRGRWAEHFSIIAWPITHSILPGYLQAHFAAHLHEIRYDLAHQGYLGIAQLGEFIRRRYYGGSSRFRDFLQQTELTARLVLALRDEDIHDEISLIHRPTLTRIVSDLEGRQSVRNHLREARKILREARLQPGNLAPGRRNEHSPSAVSTDSGLRAAAPKLIARRTATDAWHIGVALPDFTGILRSSTLGQLDLDQVRMRFGDEDGWMPGRALLSYSKKHRPLAKFPNLDSPFLRFDLPSESLTALFEPYFKLQGNFPFLLRIHEDGMARQLHGNHVRAKRAYLIIANQPVPPDILLKLSLQQMECATTGVALYQMQSPAILVEAHFQALNALQFGYGLRAQIDPVGLMPRLNGDGGSTWLPDEEVVLRLSADFSVAAYFVSIDDQQRTYIPVTGSSEVLISVGSLPIGNHTVQVSAESRVTTQRIEPESLSLEVRAHEPWRQSVRRQAGFRLLMKPVNATFEDMAEGRAEISIHGPDERTATVELRLFDAHGHVSETQRLAQIGLPANAEACRTALKKLRREPLAEKLEATPRFDIAVAVEELGYDSLTFNHDVQPLRWKLEHVGKLLMARLVDEAGADHEVVVRRYDISQPDRRAAVDTESCLAGFSVTPPGSLFVARHRGCRYAAVISLREKLTTLADLGANVRLGERRCTPSRHVAWLLVQHKRWRAARPLGPLAIVHKSKVVATIARRIAQVLCHGRWADRLDDCRHGRSQFLERLQREVGGSPGFAVAVWDGARAFKDPRDFEVSFIDKAKIYRVSTDPALCALAFRMAFRVRDVRFDGWSCGQDQLQKLIANSTLARGAYLAKLAFDTSGLDRQLSKSGVTS